MYLDVYKAALTRRKRRNIGMSRRTKTVLPCNEDQLQPQAIETRVVQKQLQH